MTGDCQIDGNCVSSMNWPAAHGNFESCSIYMLEDVSVSIDDNFGIEDILETDTLLIKGESITSTDMVPDFLSAGELISWTTDIDTTSIGWQLCFSPPTTSTSIFLFAQKFDYLH